MVSFRILILMEKKLKLFYKLQFKCIWMENTELEHIGVYRLIATAFFQRSRPDTFFL